VSLKSTLNDCKKNRLFIILFISKTCLSSISWKNNSIDIKIDFLMKQEKRQEENINETKKKTKKKKKKKL